MWTQNQRNSWHGVEYPYHSDLSIADYYKRYAETLLAVDDSLGRVMDLLEKRGELDSTYIFLPATTVSASANMASSINARPTKNPCASRCWCAAPDKIAKGAVVNEVVANIDFMPTFLEAAGVPAPEGIAGQSFLSLLAGKTNPLAQRFALHLLLGA